MHKDKTPNKEIIDEIGDMCNAMSVTDCTGLIPSAPQSEAELDSYKEVYDFEPPEPICTDPKNQLPPK